MLQVVIGLGYTLRRESIGFYHVCTSLKIAPVDILHDIWTGKTQHIIVACIQYIIAQVQPSAEVAFRETVALYHRADGTIEYQYALLDKLSYIHKQSDRNTPRPTPVSNKIN